MSPVKHPQITWMNESSHPRKFRRALDSIRRNSGTSKRKFAKLCSLMGEPVTRAQKRENTRLAVAFMVLV